jgi:hypothetical protein
MLRRAVLLAGFAVAFATAASAATVKFHATLSPAAEFPPTRSSGSGQANASLDTVTHVLSYDVTYAGISPPATAATVNGPAPAGRNAGVIMSLGMNPTSPIHGTTLLRPDQEQQLTSGLWYGNVVNQASPGGAIRGQLLPAK